MDISGDQLNESEQRIARRVAAGRRNREIAGELGLSAKTVEWHLSRIYRKLGVRSRTELAARAGAGAIPWAPSDAHDPSSSRTQLTTEGELT